MLEPYRRAFNLGFSEAAYQQLLAELAASTRANIGFRIAETPIFLSRLVFEELAEAGARLTHKLLANADYLRRADATIPAGWRAAGVTPHPHFLAADFAFIRDAGGALITKLVEIQGFPSLYGFQLELAESFKRIYKLPAELAVFPDGLNQSHYWELLRQTIVGNHDPAEVVLLELDPLGQKTAPDFLLTAQKLGIQLIDVRAVVPQGKRLFYRNGSGGLTAIRRIYNRIIADELIAKGVQLPFDWQAEWEVEWAGHPNWYFQISKYSLPWLNGDRAVPPSAFLHDFLRGPGAEQLAEAGVPLPRDSDPVYEELLLKPLFSFAGKGIRFAPRRSELLAIEPSARPFYLLQQRMNFEKTISTPEGPTQPEIRILYVWPESGALTPVLPLVRLGRGKMMGVDHNRDLRWVGASAALLAH